MDLYNLFRFLRCSPFDDLRVFTTQVTENWKARSDPECIGKLKTMVNCLSLRRPKDTIELLPRSDEVYHLVFNRREQQDYDRAKSSTLSCIDHFGSNSEERGSKTLINALKWLNILRLICNHGSRSSEQMQKAEVERCRSEWNPREAQNRFDQLDAAGLAKCSNLACRQDLSSVPSNEADTEHEDEPWIGELLEIWCCVCFKEKSRQAINAYKVCNHIPRFFQESNTLDDLNDASNSTASPPLSLGIASANGENVPTKVKRLIEDLVKTPDDIKRYLFSSPDSPISS